MLSHTYYNCYHQINKIISLCKLVEKVEPLCAVGGNIKCIHCRKQCGTPSKKLKIELPNNLAIPLLCI